MPRPMPEQLRELAEDVRGVRLAPAAEVRARGRSRARRRTTVTTAAVAVALAAGGLGLAGALRPEPGSSAGPVPAAQPDRCPGLDLRLPDDPQRVGIVVSAGPTTANSVVRDLGNRGFRATAGAKAEAPAGAAVLLRYGPRAVGNATVVAALVGGLAATSFDPERTDTAVDLVVGPSFTRLNSTTEVNQALATAGEPTRPAECG
jgi:hypothetical protein